MKKILFSIVATVAFFLSNSCGGPDVPALPKELPTFVEPAVADAEAAVEAAEEFKYLLWVEPYGSIAYYLAIGTLSAAASLTSSETSLIAPVAIELPVELSLSQNPYESIGIIHNSALAREMSIVPTNEYRSVMTSRFINTIIDYSAAAVSNNINSGTRILITENVKKQFQVHAQKNHVELQKYFLKNTSAWMYNVNITTQVYIKTFMSNFERLKGDNLVENIKIINREIINVINSNDTENNKSLKLIGLSVFKHSYFLWHNHN